MEDNMKKIICFLALFAIFSSVAYAASTSITDIEKRGRNAEPIAIESFTVDFVTAVGSSEIVKNGILRQLAIVVPDLSDSGNMTVTVSNADSVIIFTSSAFTENITSSQLIAVNSSPLLAGTMTVTVNAPDTQANAVDKTVSLIFYID
jgi:hypothetical protein